jgi:hypothetical protein
MSSKKSGGSQADTRSRVKKLKQAGLYKGDLRKPTTRYAKSLTRKYADVIEGRAKVITVPKTPTKRSKGVKAARQEAEALANKFQGIMRNKLDKVIVRVSHPKEKVGYSKREQKVYTSISRGDQIETHEYAVVQNGQLPALEKNQAYGLPVRRMGGEIGYIMRATEAEILALANEYEMRPKHMYKGATGHIQIVYSGRLRRHRKPRTKAKSNVVPFPGRKK